MDDGALTIRVTGEYLERLESLAESTGRSASSIAEDALRLYLDGEEWRAEAIRQAIADLDAGETPIEHARVAAWLRSWGTENELPPPQ